MQYLTRMMTAVIRPWNTTPMILASRAESMRWVHWIMTTGRITGKKRSLESILTRLDDINLLLQSIWICSWKVFKMYFFTLHWCSWQKSFKWTSAVSKVKPEMLHKNNLAISKSMVVSEIRGLRFILWCFYLKKECVVRQREQYVTALTKTVHKKIKEFLPTFFFNFLKPFHKSVALDNKRKKS